MSERFVFGIALVARAQASDWRAIETLLGLTLSSVAAQTEADFEVIVAGHDRPDVLPDDPRLRFLPVDWAPFPPDEHNSDGGMKKHRIAETVLAEGGGLLMLLDADDWVDARLVETTRRSIGASAVGGVIEDGFAVDVRARKALALPDPRAFDIGFHRVCGSSVVGRLDPDARNAVRRDPCHALGSHHQWIEAAGRAGVRLARVAAPGAYLVNTSQNHSEWHGPHGPWRRCLSARVAEHGAPLDPALLQRFGLAPAQIDAAVHRLGGPSPFLEIAGKAPGRRHE
jgi:hypothetical protein